MKRIERWLIGLVVALISVFVIVAVFRLSGGSPALFGSTFAPRVSCPSDEVDGYLARLDTTLRIWNDMSKLAESTSRIALSPVINNMLDQKHGLIELAVPACATYINELALLMMDTEVDAYLGFMQQMEDAELNPLYRRLFSARDIFDRELAAFRISPLSAYQEANPVASKPNIVNTHGWTPANSYLYQFLVPVGWLTLYGDELGQTEFVDTTGHITGYIFRDDDIDLSPDRSPRANLASLELYTDPLVTTEGREYIQLGENHVYLSRSKSAHKDGIARVDGGIVTPDGATYTLMVSKGAAILTEEEQQMILGMMSTIASE